MHSYTLLPCLAALAGHAAAEAFQLAGYEAIPAPTPTTGPRLGRRQDMDCFASISNELLVVDEPSATDLADWLSSQTDDISECTITAPAFLSSDLMSYASSVSDFWEGAESRFDAIDTMCGVEELRFELTQIGCTETQTVLFTSGSDTETVDLPFASIPTGVMTKTSGAAGQSGMMSVAGVAGVALFAMLAL